MNVLDFLELHVNFDFPQYNNFASLQIIQVKTNFIVQYEFFVIQKSPAFQVQWFLALIGF